MPVLAELDVRICQLEEEFAQLKVTRNGHTPLGRLPDEVLMQIYESASARGLDRLT
jgi:hypothetical protein